MAQIQFYQFDFYGQHVSQKCFLISFSFFWSLLLVVPWLLTVWFMVLALVLMILLVLVLVLALLVLVPWLMLLLNNARSCLQEWSLTAARRRKAQPTFGASLGNSSSSDCKSTSAGATLEAVTDPTLSPFLLIYLLITSTIDPYRDAQLNTSFWHYYCLEVVCSVEMVILLIKKFQTYLLYP